MTIKEILDKYQLPPRLVVEFAYLCAIDVVKDAAKEGKYALSLVKRWLDGDTTVTADMLTKAASVAYSAAYNAASSAAANAAYNVASNDAYRAAYNAASSDDAKMEEYRLLLLQMINTKLSKFERLILNIPANLK